MSVPATNALPPAPRRTSTRTSSSASTASQCATSASYIAKVIALCASGRSNVTHAADAAPLEADVAQRVQLAQDLVGVLAEQRRGPPDRRRAWR